MNKLGAKNSKSKAEKSVFAKKSFGQNFLIDANYIEKIIDALDLQTGETVLEIGAGRGALTERLVESGANVVAIELEHDMIAVLKEKFGGESNFQLIEANALKVDYTSIEIQNSKIKLVANLPYYISTAILQRLIEQRAVFSRFVLMFQREVVERITARVGDSERGFLSILAQNYLEIERLFDVPPRAFRPAPKVWSAVARLTPKANAASADDEVFRRVVSAAFAQRRKTIFNNLKNAPEIFGGEFCDVAELLENCNVETTRRAETLTIDEWNCLANSICEANE